MLRRILLSAALVLVSSTLAFAQEKTVTGTVTDADSGFPLPGVNISVQGTLTGTATGIDGTYSIRVNTGDVLVFSFVGYLPQEVTVADQTTINVALQEDVALLSEVVVVGYGTQRKADVTGAVSNVNVADANVGIVQSPEQMLQGRVSGVRVVQNDGEPGAGVTIRVRGGTSISASNDPLYVVDGVPIDNSSTQPNTFSLDGNADNNGPRNPLSFINPSDIASIDVLKDASAAAIYGSRGANGVILITTKKGQAGQLSVNYSGRLSVSQLRKKIDLLSASEYRQFVSDFGLGNSLGGANTDWQDEIFSDATSQDHNLSFSGGTELTRYRASVGYRDQEGIVVNSGQERVTGNLSASHKAMEEKLELNVNLNGSFVNDNLTPTTETNGFESTLLGNVVKFNPTLPVTDTDSGCLFDTGSGFCEIGTSVRNPVAIAEQIQDFVKTSRILGGFNANYKFTSALSAKVNVGLDQSSSTRRTYVPKTSPLQPGITQNGTAAQNTLQRGSRLIELTGQYQEILSDVHSVTLLGGYSWQDFVTESFGVETRDFVTDFVGFNNLGLGASEQKPSSSKEASKLISFFGRVN
ncbi:MAG: SusC/RagA family TonB-linked outer membrane protein, partial [Rhodothermales bacterium]|nr:SusC/RagA family TonB-linked outer membrane protein [Rhodothermales bacterium]